MRAYLLRCALFVAIGLPPASLLWFASFRMPPSYAERAVVESVRRVINEADELEALTIGSSHAKAINFNLTSTEGLPLGLPWSDLFEVDHQLRTLVPELPELEIVFIALSYFSFHWDNAEAGNDNLLTSRRVFYAATPTAGWVDDDPGTFLTGKIDVLTRPDLWRNVVLRVLGRDPYEEQRRRMRRANARVRTHAELAAHAQRRVGLKQTYMDSIALRRPDVAERAYETIASTIEFLRDEGKHVVLYTPPFYRAYNDLFAVDPRLHEMQHFARRLEREHGVRWLDFSHDPLSLQPTLFRDSDHLNVRGRREFSRKLLDAACVDPAVQTVSGLCS